MKPHRAKVLVVGCPRSGTMFTAVLLQALGLDVRHEAMGYDGAVSWREAKGKPFSYRRVKIDGSVESGPVEFEHVFHQVRAPLPTIASMSTMGPQAWRYIYRTISTVDPQASTLLRSMQLWHFMNQKFECQAERTFRIEDIDVVLRGLCEILGIRYSKRALKSVPRNVNAREHPGVGWADLFTADSKLTTDISDMAGRYGYEHDPDDMFIDKGGNP